MKKIIITLVASAFAFSVNAQQGPFVLKAPQSGGLLRQQLLKLDSPGRNSLLFKQPDSVWAKPVFRVNVTGKVNIDNMPMARMPGNSNMPVVQTDRTAYNMPIAGMNQPRIYTMTVKNLSANPEVSPFFGGKAPIYYDLKKYPNNTPPVDSIKKK